MQYAEKCDIIISYRLLLTGRKMKKTFREKFVAGCGAKVKKHKWLKKPMTLYVMVVLSVYYAGLNLVSTLLFLKYFMLIRLETALLT